MILADDYRPTSYWLDDAPLPEPAADALPARIDVLIVGAGYTGLAAAEQTALAGRSTLVLDAGPIGGGCSSRNGGQVAFSLKPAYVTLARCHGADTARRLYEEGIEAVADLRRRSRHEGLDADWRDVGCFIGAHTPRHFAALVRDAETQPRGLELPFKIVPRTSLAEEVDSPLYHGGVVYTDDAAVHPARLLHSLHALAVAAGAVCRAHCAVRSITPSGAGFAVETMDGVVHARQVLIATNGYTGPFSPWHQRRILPIGSYILATEPLDPERVRRLIPRGRNVGDTRRVVIYLRPSPDGRRILFGGRAAAGEVDVTRCLPRLRAMMGEVFPELAAVRVSRAWMGFVGFTFDTMPHLGTQDGVHYCMGYCGQGIPSATYYGRKVGLQMVGRPGGETALSGLSFPARAYYRGTPWFLPAAVLGYRLGDWLGL